MNFLTTSEHFPYVGICLLLTYFAIMYKTVLVSVSIL